MKKIFLLQILTIIVYSSYSQVRVSLSGSGTPPYNTWAKATPNIQTGMTYANDNGITEVWVAEGTYQNGQLSLRNVEVYGGFPDTGNPNFAARDYVANETILDGGNLNRVIYNSGTLNNTSILDGFTIQRGNKDNGGGLYLRNCKPIIQNCKIINNHVTGDGGGVYLRDADATFIDCLFEGNVSTDDGGGAYFIGAESTFTNCKFYGNSTGLGGGQVGGAIYVSGGNPIFNTVIIDLNNQANDGAGVYIGNGNSIFNDCDINNNTATDDGGGVFINNGNSTFTNCDINNNIAVDYCGGVYVNQGSPVFSSCVVDGNTATDHGGGVYLTNVSAPTFSNCTVSNNSTTGTEKFGGGFHIASASSPNINGCTIQGNSANGNGGGLYSSSSTWSVALNNNQFIANTCTGSGNNSRGRGAGAYIEDNCPPITNNTFTNNVATNTTVHQYNGSGGALCVNGESPQIVGNNFTGNRAVSTASKVNSARGGAIYFMNSSAILTNNTFNNNEAGYGGAIFTNNCALTFSGNTYSGNKAISYMDNTGLGGAIAFYGTSGTGSVITGETFQNNDADPGLYANSGWGGALYFNGNGLNATLDQVTIQNNTAKDGAGICIDNGADPVFSKNNITSNVATGRGGALFIDATSSYKMTNSLIYGNNAVNGGAIAARNNNDANYYNLNNTIANNTATNGGALYFENSCDMRFRNTIFWGNTANGNQVYILDTGSDPYFDNCDMQGGTAAFVNGAGAYDGSRYTPDALCDNQDPLFSDGLFHLTLGTSPCIGTGHTGTGAGDFPSDEDYDSEKRIRGVVDIGAYETNNPPQFVKLPFVLPLPATGVYILETVTMDEDATPTAFSLTLNAVDLDDESLIWSIATAPSNGTAVATGTTNAPNPHSLAIGYTPNADFNGTDWFIVQVSDGKYIDQIRVDVIIDQINDAPIITSTPNPTFIKAQQTWTYNISTSDIDHLLSQLTVTCTSKPAGMTFTPGANGTAVLSWTPGDLDLGSYSITLQVDDTGMPVENDVQTFTFTVLSRFINVPADYPTIQLGVDAALDGDKVFVAAGTYPEHVIISGKTIDIEGDPANPAAVIIDGSNSGTPLTIESGGSSVIDGFTLTNGSGTFGLPSTTTLHAPSAAYYGGGIFIFNSDPTLKNIIVENNSLTVNSNHGGSGSGIYIGNNSTVIIEGPNTVIQNNNSVIYRGGGICIDDSNVTIDGIVNNGVKIQNNTSGNYGAGIGAYNSTVDFIELLISGNSLDGDNARGTGIYYHNTPRTETSVSNPDGRYEFP